jgi:hypothetical protein
MHKLIFTLVFSLVITGCTNGYNRYYTSTVSVNDIKTYRDTIPSINPEVIKIKSRNDIPAIIDEQWKNGYIGIGYSEFYSSIYWDLIRSESRAISQGIDVSADRVFICDPLLNSSTTSVIPISTPTSNTAYTTGTIYGYGGSLNYNSTTTIAGVNTSHVPYTSNEYSFCAGYFVKENTRLVVFGILPRELTNDEKSKMNTNKGVAVRLVKYNTPAYEHDILVNDIIMKIDDIFLDYVTYRSVIESYKHRQIKVTLIRNGETIIKTIQLN